MSVPQNLINKSVVLQPGEQYILPPGAVIVGASSPTSLNSSCPIGELEDLECYAFILGNAQEDGNNEQLFEDQSFPALGFSANGVYRDFPSPFYPVQDNGRYDLEAIVAAINIQTGGALVTPVTAFVSRGDNGTMSYIVFKSIPSVAKTLELKMSAATSEGFSVEQSIELWIKPRLRSTLDFYPEIPNCA